MFTPKDNSEKKGVKYDLQVDTDRLARSCHATHGPCVLTENATHGPCRATHGHAQLTAQFFRFFSFRHFTRKIQTINPFSMSFSSTRY